MSTTVTTKGQVTIPKPVRDVLGIGPGSRVTFELLPDGGVTLRKDDGETSAASRPNRFARLRGRATAGMSTDEIMALTRGNH